MPPPARPGTSSGPWRRVRVLQSLAEVWRGFPPRSPLDPRGIPLRFTKLVLFWEAALPPMR